MKQQNRISGIFDVIYVQVSYTKCKHLDKLQAEMYKNAAQSKSTAQAVTTVQAPHLLMFLLHLSHGTSYRQLAGPGFISGARGLQSKSYKAQISSDKNVHSSINSAISIPKIGRTKKLCKRSEQKFFGYYGFN